MRGGQPARRHVGCSGSSGHAGSALAEFFAPLAGMATACRASSMPSRWLLFRHIPCHPCRRDCRSGPPPDCRPRSRADTPARLSPERAGRRARPAGISHAGRARSLHATTSTGQTVARMTGTTNRVLAVSLVTLPVQNFTTCPRGHSVLKRCGCGVD